MAQNIAFIVGSAWLVWCLFHVGLLLASPYLLGRQHIVTNGFITAFPQHLRDKLTPEQQAAILAHEEGHKAHRHALKNLLRTFFFLRRSPKMAMVQEIEADQYAADRGHAEALATALRKLSGDAFDWYRARRLDDWRQRQPDREWCDAGWASGS